MMTFIRFISEAVSKHSAYTKSLSNKAFKNDKALNKSVKTIESILAIPRSLRTEEQEAILKHRYNAHVIKVASAKKGQWLNDYTKNGWTLWQAHLKSDRAKQGTFVMAYSTKGEDAHLLVVGSHDDTTGG